ncbi:Holliday junction resolvase RecU [Bacilli bacterium]|nr:Holliday junction resolvase RecU [Bacilli bacterium]
MVANRGMYLEELVNRTANYCFINKIAIIEKREIPIKIIKKINDDTVIGKLTKKSKLDYFCYVNNKYFEFDAKETNEDVFRISNIASHQLEYMHSLSTNMINSYILIYFNKYSKIYMVGYE